MILTPTEVIGHRGSGRGTVDGLAENTPESFAAALPAEECQDAGVATLDEVIEVVPPHVGLAENTPESFAEALLGAQEVER